MRGMTLIGVGTSTCEGGDRPSRGEVLFFLLLARFDTIPMTFL